jgi:purine nucleosidase
MADHRTPAADIVVEAYSHPDLQPVIADGLLFWWDPLTAMSIVHLEFVQFTSGRADVVTDGPAAGRTFLSPTGRLLRYGVAADRTAFEERFLNTVNGRPWPGQGERSMGADIGRLVSAAASAVP